MSGGARRVCVVCRESVHVGGVFVGVCARRVLCVSGCVCRVYRVCMCVGTMCVLCVGGVCM